MSKGALSVKMLEVLKELAKPKAVAYYLGYMGRIGGDYWFIDSISGRCSKQIRGLIKRGFVEPYDFSHRGNKARITNQGRQYLREIEGGK